MPELPEVETIRRTLERRLAGRTIERVDIGDWTGVIGETDPQWFIAESEGSSIARVSRRGKYLRLHLSGERSLLIHLRMTGQLLLVSPTAGPVRFERLRINLGKIDLRFADQRKFGRVLLLKDEAVELKERELGIEPFDEGFTTAWLEKRLAGRTSPIKSFLLDQRFIAGIGNIYADEALFRAQIHPMRRAGSLDRLEIARLADAIPAVLEEGIQRRGTTFSSYRDASGEAGTNVRNLRVYGRSKGGRCFTCGGEIVSLVISGRTSHFCPNCQPLEPVASRRRRAGTVYGFRSDASAEAPLPRPEERLQRH